MQIVVADPGFPKERRSKIVMLSSQECYRVCAYFDPVISERVLCLFHNDEYSYS